MSNRTAGLNLPYSRISNNSQDVFNEAIRQIDALLQGGIVDRDLTAPPGSPTQGATYIPAAVATGAWAGKENYVATYWGTSWVFYTPSEGWMLWVEDENLFVYYTGSAWAKFGLSLSLTSAELRGILTDETGTGAAVFADTPTLVAPVLGTPGSGTLTNCTGLPIATGVSGLAAGVAAFLATPSSANLASLVTDETGTGVLVFATSPSFTTDIRPSANDAASLGISGTAFSDLFLASGAVISFDASDLTLTHSADKLTLLTNTALTNSSILPLQIRHETSGTPANSIGVGIEFAQETAAGNVETLGDFRVIATDVTAGSEDGAFIWRLMAAGATAAELMRLNSAAVLTLGGSSNNYTGINGSTGRAQTHATSGVASYFGSTWANNNTGWSAVTLAKSRGAAVNTQTIVADGDTLGEYGWMGSDGTAMRAAASIRAEVDGTPGASDMPGRILLMTSSDGGITLTERLRVDAAGNVLAKSAGGLGYGTGAGGTVTQATNKATGVTLNKGSGQITMNNAALAAATTVAFTLTNSVIAATDCVVVNHGSAGTAGSYLVWATTFAAGSCVIQVQNISGGSLSEAIVLHFAVIKGAAS
jgi:hypothetical protein